MIRIEGVIEEGSNAITEGRDAVHELRSMGLTTTDLAESIRNLAKELLGNLSSENLPEFLVQVEGRSKRSEVGQAAQSCTVRAASH